MKKKLMKMICMAFLTSLCLGVNAQNPDSQSALKTALPVNFDAATADVAPIREGVAITPENPAKRVEITDYVEAYIGDTRNGNYVSVNLTTGEKTTVGSIVNPPFPSGEDFDGTSIYRLHGSAGSGKIVKVNENGATTPVGTITGATWNNTIGLAYDWIKKDGTWYFYNVETSEAPFNISLYSLNMTTLVATKIGATITNANFMRGLALANDGYLYAIATSISSLVRIDPVTAVVKQVGQLGFVTTFGQDLAFDRETNILYASPLDYYNDFCLFGTININTGAFTEIKNYGSGQHATLVICKTGPNITPCPVVTNLNATQLKGNLAKITWNAPEITDGLTAYKIYDGITEIAAIAADKTTFVTPALAIGNHNFAVEAIYDECTPKKITTNLTITTCGEPIEGVDVVYNNSCVATVSWDAVAKTGSNRGVIYNNGPFITHPGQGYGGADAAAFGVEEEKNFGGNASAFIYSSMADDFVLTSTTVIESIDFYCYQVGLGTTSPINAVVVRIWNGSPLAGGTVIWGELDVDCMISTEFSNIYRVKQPDLTNTDRPLMVVKAGVPLTLEPGTYWVEVSIDGKPLTPGPYVNQVTILGQKPNGNALHNINTGWLDWIEEGTGAQCALPFIIYGEAGEAPAPKYNVYMGDELVASGIEGTSYTHTASVPQGVDIQWYVTQACPFGGESVAGSVTKKCGSALPCDKVTGATAEADCKKATITWDAVAEAKEYKIIGEGVETTVAGTTYTEEGIFENGKTYQWSIITICDEGSSDPVGVSAIANCDGINAFANTISIYPNPAQNGTVNITAANFAKVEVYSAIGQLMVTQNTPTVDVSNYQDGIYFFKVFDNNNNTAMKRISVIK